MSELDLKRKAEELEQTLHKQFEMMKSDTETWVKIGGAVVVSGLVTFGLVRAFQGRKSKKIEKALQQLESEGMIAKSPDNRYYYPPMPVQKQSFWAPVMQRVLMAAFDFGKARLLAEIARRVEGTDERARRKE
jgi:hypothetical protein